MDINKIEHSNSYMQNRKLYKFLAVNYGISDLVQKLEATKNIDKNKIMLQNFVNSVF